MPIYSVITSWTTRWRRPAIWGANTVTVFRKVILPPVAARACCPASPWCSSRPCPRSPSAGCWAAARELLLGDLIERQFLGGAYNPQLGAAISLVMMLIVVVCMLVMNRFGEGEEQAVML